MKRNKFRLETVMRIRRTQEEVEVGRLSLALGASSAARALEAERERRYLDTVHGSSLAGSTPTTTDDFLATRAAMELMGDAVVVAHAEVLAADEVVAERRAEWSVAAKRVAALERLHERHSEAHQADVLAEEISEADERTMARRLRELQSPPSSRAVPAARAAAAATARVVAATAARRATSRSLTPDQAATR